MDFFEAVKSRRSVRKFQPTPFPDEYVNKAFEAAVIAPSSSNTQTWDFHWVKNPDMKAKLVECCLSQSAARTANHLVVATANSRNWKRSHKRLIDWAKTSAPHPSVAAYYEKLVPVMYTAGFFSLFAPIKWVLAFLVGLTRPMMRGPFTQNANDIVAIKSAALACENFVLAISAQGGGTCMMEGFDDCRVRKLLKLSFGTQIVMVIAVGYPDERGIWGSRYRIPTNEVVHVYQ